jgi:hypothetical protein
MHETKVAKRPVDGNPEGSRQVRSVDGDGSEQSMEMTEK